MEKIRYRVLYVDGPCVIGSQGHRLYKSTDNGETWAVLYVLPVSCFVKLLMFFSLTARLLRLDIHHCQLLCDGSLMIIANKKVYAVSDKGAVAYYDLVGSRPMGVCGHRDKFYYGEYRSNAERTAVSIWGVSCNEDKQRACLKFDGVRHIHGIYYDSVGDLFWITTGDSDEESAIWCTNTDFTNLKKVVSGGQQSRAVQLLFSDEYIYFGSDTPFEKNFIYRTTRNGSQVEQLVEVGGSVFYGSSVGGRLYFSTAVEPSVVNNSPKAELWKSEDGENWSMTLSLKKDILPDKYFQHGQILFPAGPGNDRYLYYTPLATKGHGQTYRVPVC